MTYSVISLIAAFVIMTWAVVDWRRGSTGLLHMRLTKEKTPDKYWYVIVLYINMAIGLFWLSGNVNEPYSLCDTSEGGRCTITIEVVEP